MADVEVRKLYRVVRRHCYNGGNRTEVGKVEVLYCGYDRFEAVRVKHGNVGGGNVTPGGHYTEIVLQSKDVS